MFGKTLIISPHRDDEVLGCGGLISQISPNQLHIRYYNSHHTDVPDDVYDRENIEFIKRVGCGCSYCPKSLQKVNGLSTYNISLHIADIEETVNKYRPDTILIPFPSYNQDHRHLFEACITATRPHDTNWYVKNVLVYEQPCVRVITRIAPTFIPHVFLPISIDRKLDLYTIYQSQYRGHRTFEHVRSLAVMRGMQCNQPYAEAFMVIRQTI